MKNLIEMLNLLSFYFDEFVNNVQSLADEQDMDEYDKDPHGTVLRIMKSAMAGVEADKEGIKELSKSMDKVKAIDISEVISSIEEITGKNNKGNGGQGGLH